MHVTRLLSGRSDPERFDLYTRGSLYVLVYAEPLMALGLVGAIEVETPASVVYWLVGLSVVHAAACVLLLRAGLRHRSMVARGRTDTTSWPSL